MLNTMYCYVCTPHIVLYCMLEHVYVGTRQVAHVVLLAPVLRDGKVEQRLADAPAPHTTHTYAASIAFRASRMWLRKLSGPGYTCQPPRQLDGQFVSWFIKKHFIHAVLRRLTGYTCTRGPGRVPAGGRPWGQRPFTQHANPLCPCALRAHTRQAVHRLASITSIATPEEQRDSYLFTTSPSVSLASHLTPHLKNRKIFRGCASAPMNGLLAKCAERLKAGMTRSCGQGSRTTEDHHIVALPFLKQTCFSDSRLTEIAL
jgi:hypothetical protein